MRSFWEYRDKAFVQGLVQPGMCHPHGKPLEAICHPSPYSRALWSCTQHPSEQLKLWHVAVAYPPLLVHLLLQMLLDSSVVAAPIPCESGPVPLAFLIQVTL